MIAINHGQERPEPAKCIILGFSTQAENTPKTPPRQNIRSVTSQDTEYRNEKLGSIQVAFTTKGLED
jgi:hypothetical protein